MITNSVKTTIPPEPPARTAPPDDDWTMDIQANPGLLDVNLREVWRYRDLVGLIVRRDFVSSYKQTILGPVWHLTEPLVTTLTYAFIFGFVARISTEGMPRILFYLPGITLWTFFANSLLQTAGTFSANAGIFGKVYFPRLVAPIATVLTNMIALGLQMALFLVLMAVYFAQGAPIRPTPYALLTPLLVLVTAGLALGFGTLLSSVTIKYRDLQKLVNVSMRLLMFGTPIIYPLSKVSGWARQVILLNPMTPIVEAFRYGWLGTGSFSWGWLAYSTGLMLVMLAWGLLVFNRAEKVAMDSV
ncbi:MAG: ABC transporter permease [Cytophagales bacterium]|nr:ABC transporter permease [Cytophagales bacterium]